MINFVNRVIRYLRRQSKGIISIIFIPFKHRRSLKRLKGKEVLNCVFLALFEEIWKYDSVYRLMVDNKRFNPIILVCPAVDYGKDNMIARMDKCYEKMREKGYNVIRAYDRENDSYIDLRKELQPDIIFYTTPYKKQIDKRYYISDYQDILSVYVPYYINSNKDYPLSCDLLAHNLVWRRYVETGFHRQLSVKHARNRGINAVITGYPGIEPFLKESVSIKNNDKKCIIWAPHHTIKPVGLVHYSCFLQYCDLMLDLADKYSEDACFVFKPHPILKNQLYEKWGRKKTEEYYRQWSEKENTSLNESEYIDLFKRSNAMIHDSASFIVEYLYLNKPVMRTLNGENLEDMFNSFGMQCIEQHYLAKTREDIEQFIRNVIAGVDPMKKQRTEFVNKVLMPKGSPSQNIIDDILDSIDSQILYRN